MNIFSLHSTVLLTLQSVCSFRLSATVAAALSEIINYFQVLANCFTKNGLFLAQNGLPVSQKPCFPFMYQGFKHGLDFVKILSNSEINPSSTATCADRGGNKVQNGGERDSYYMQNEGFGKLLICNWILGLSKWGEKAGIGSSIGSRVVITIGVRSEVRSEARGVVITMSF